MVRSKSYETRRTFHRIVSLGYTFVRCRILAAILDAVRRGPFVCCLEQQRWHQPSVAGSLLRYGFAEVLIGCPIDIFGTLYLCRSTATRRRYSQLGLKEANFV